MTLVDTGFFLALLDARIAALQTLNLASRSQLTGVAKQIVDLEERLERVEDAVLAVLKKLDELPRAREPERPSKRPAASPEAG